MMMMTEMADDQKRRSHHHDGFMLQAAAAAGGCSAKKVKTGGGGGGSISPKEKKDRVGERVAALQQLVSPFGKTDTASVLQEATGYIKFLHEQLQVLSAPYLRTGPDGNMQEKAAFIFCVEDRALFCRNCDEAIHVAGALSGNHQRYLATGIRVALSSICNKDSEKGHYEPPKQNFPLMDPKVPTTHESPSSFMPSAWTVDEFLQLSDYESGDKKGSSVGLGELEWFTDIGLFHEQIPNGTLTAAEVPELPTSQASNAAFYRNKASMSHKKPRIEISDEEEYFTVPDLG